MFTHSVLDGASFVEQTTIVVGQILLVVFVLALLLLGVFGLMPKGTQLRVAAATTRLERVLQRANARAAVLFAIVVVIASLGLVLFSFLTLALR